MNGCRRAGGSSLSYALLGALREPQTAQGSAGGGPARTVPVHRRSQRQAARNGTSAANHPSPDESYCAEHMAACYQNNGKEGRRGGSKGVETDL